MSPLDKDPATGLNAALAEQLRAERAAAQITFDELAERSDISKRTLIRLFKAERHIDVAALDSICQALGIDLHTMLSRAGERMSSTVVAHPAFGAGRGRESMRRHAVEPGSGDALAAHDDDLSIEEEQERHHTT